MRLESWSFGDRNPQRFAVFFGLFQTGALGVDHGYYLNSSNTADSWTNLSAMTSAIVGFFINPQANTNQPIFSFAQDATKIADLWYNNTNSKYEIRANGVSHGVSAGIYGPNFPIHAQLKLILGSSGFLELRINHTADIISFTGPITVGTLINRIYFHATGGGGIFDSFWLNDMLGSVDNDYSGVVHMLDMPFIADDPDDNAFGKVGSASGFANIDEAPASLADYNFADVNGIRQAYVPAAHGLAFPSVIQAFTTTHLVDMVSSGGIIPYVKIGATRSDGALHSPGVSPYPMVDRRILHPSGANWTLTDSPNFGLKASL